MQTFRPHWGSYLQYDGQERPDIDRALLKRVWSYGKPYRRQLIGVIVTVLVISSLGVLPPLLTRQLIDEALPNKDLRQLTLLGLGIVALPLLTSLIGIVQRWWSSRAGEGIIYDLRRQLYDHLQNMSLRFFTATKTGELISRVNTDVVGAQQAITGTFVTVFSNLVTVAVILAVMLQSEWRLTLLAVAALPLFTLPAKRVARVLRRITDQQMERNAAMSAILQETFNISGALLVKLFGRAKTESERYGVEAAGARDLGVRSAMVGRWFFATIGLSAALGSAAVFWVGGYLVIQDQLTLGTVVMFTTLVAQLYGPLSSLSNSRVELATSLVSFERVFEVIDMVPEITEGTLDLPAIRGDVEFDDVYFRYTGRGARSASRRCVASAAAAASTRVWFPCKSRAGNGRSRASPSGSRRGNWWRWSDRAAPGRRRSRTSYRGSTTSTRAKSASMATTSRISPFPPWPAESVSSPRRHFCSTTPSPPIFDTPARMQPTPNSRRPARPPTFTTSSRRYRTDTSRWWGSEATDCRAARGSAWRLRG